MALPANTSSGADRGMSDMSRTLTHIIRAVVPLWLAMVPVAQATSLAGTWCSRDGETIVQYFVSGSDVTALTVLSETDPRQVGSRTSLPLDEARVLASSSYIKCDQGQAWARAQAFLSSPAAEEATRKALQAEIARKSEVELLQLEDAETEQRRNAERDAYFAELIQQLSVARRSRS
jgi:hypothetical protein